MKTTILLPDDLMTEVKVLAARERRKLGEMMTELVQAGIESRAQRKRRATPARKAAQEWFQLWNRLGEELSAALPTGGDSLVAEMIRNRRRSPQPCVRKSTSQHGKDSLRESFALADKMMKKAPPGPSARELLEQDRNRLEPR